MSKRSFAARIRGDAEHEVELAAARAQVGDLDGTFRHLERAHVLGQADTALHTRVHWLMLKAGWRKKDWRGGVGQVLRVGAAATKTPLGIYPAGNTGGADVSAVRPMPIPEDLREKIRRAGGDA